MPTGNQCLIYDSKGEFYYFSFDSYNHQNIMNENFLYKRNNLKNQCPMEWRIERNCSA